MTTITIHDNGKITVDGTIPLDAIRKLINALAGNTTIIMNLTMSEDGGFDESLNEKCIFFNNSFTGKLGEDILKGFEKYRIFLPGQAKQSDVSIKAEWK